MRKIIVLFFILSTHLLAQNSGKISGTIVDTKTNEPLLSVNVLIRGTSLGAVTDINGQYFILNIPPGEYDISASMVGYQTLIQQKVIVNVNRTTNLDFSLSEVTVQGEEVIITAERPDVEREKSSTSEIRRGDDVVNVPGIQDISDVIALNADVSDGHFRGGRDNEQLYNLQGMGIMNPLSSASAFNPIMSAVEEVEVITSGFGAQYGNAQSGIVNITMKEGNPEKWTARGEVRLRAPGRKHFGPSLWDPDTNANPYIAMLATPDKWVGSNGYWGAVGSGYSNRYGKDTATLASMLYTMWRMQAHREIGNSYDNLQDYSLDANFGGPLAKNLRMFLAVHSETSWPILPTPEPNVNRQLMGNLVYDFGSGMNLRLSGAYSRADGHMFSGLTTTGWYNWVWDPVFNVKLTLDENLQLGLRWSQAISKSTYYEIKLNSLHTISRDGSPAYNPDFYAQLNPNLVWDSWSTNLPDGFNFGQLENDFVNEKTTSINLDASITSQVSLSHMLQAGIQGNWYVLDVNDIGSLSVTGGGYKTQYLVKPFDVGLYVQDKMEFQGMIASVGLRLDVYNPNMFYYTDTFNPYRYTDPVLEIQKTNEQLAPKEATSTVARLQPRAGFSFPVSTYTVFHVNYGTFLQRPPFQYLTAQQFNRNELLTKGTVLSVTGILGNPRLRPEVTNSYDIGVTQGLGEGFTLDISGYYKDVKDLLQRAVYSTSSAAYTTYINLDYADIRGFRVGLAKRRGIFTGTINYTYGIATGKNASPDGNQYPTIDESGSTKYQTPVPLDVFLDFDRTHNLVANLGLSTPKLWGPSVFGIYPFEEFTIAATSFARSGRPFSSSIDKSTLMNRRTPPEYTTNLKVTKQISRFFGSSATFYVEISNLFNDRIYNYTAVFNPDQTNTANLQKWTKAYENGEDIRYYEDDLRPGFLINQEFRIYSNAPRSVQVGMIINL